MNKKSVFTIKDIDIQLLSLQSCAGRDGLATSCTIKYKGVKILYARDAGDGGEMNFDNVILRDNPKYAETEKLIKELEAEVDKLPPQKTQYGEMEFDLALLVSEIADEMDFMKACKRKMKTKILIRYENNETSSFYWKGRTLAQIASIPKGLEAMQKRYDEVQEGEVMFTDYLKSLGIRIKE